MDLSCPPAAGPFYGEAMRLKKLRSGRMPKGAPRAKSQREDSNVDLPVPLPESEDHLIGKEGIYRLGFTAMPVLELPREVRVGLVEIRQVAGPVLTVETLIAQRPTFVPIYDKSIQMGVVATGLGAVITLAEL